ncbi:asparagine synthase (glutamine-hydrolyzing) [Stigmatella aurantiaca]|uniref:asparagine synthase (glutamine-hydrolyzing) n=2 Tax=Stigmatella aurantiaca (strain DW4/3-1) TaxID=378806 RepID=E3FSE2_STIAD|nr:asparagine synthase (glutamine-hydrolyzing) [Stigmatella aurantiaca]ADO72053.1 Asparagine synthase, glutamine-hydrolyzing [Stigmatella aurantiaca DW4/3-1]
MCGIAGIFGGPDPVLLERMTRRLHHRGPDGHGTAVVGQAGLGNTRLSLLDWEGGAQPMTGRTGLTLVYNGELYNHATLRRSLEQEGVAFQTRSDTEVLLRALEQRGLACLEELEGMFAFAFSDGARLTLVRDAFGIKPLYYALVDGGRRLVFASELKALLVDPALPRELDRTSLFEWATFRFTLGERTLFKAVRQVPPGGTLEVSREPDGTLTLRAGRHSPPRPLPLPEREEDRIKLLRERLTESVRGQWVADHPVGIFLSGGVDSSLLAALLAQGGSREIHTFSLADDPTLPDLAVSRRLSEALGTHHHEYSFEPDTLLESLPRSICSLEAPGEPTIVESAAPLIRNHVKAVLCGDGADELFAGYVIHSLPGPWLKSCMEGYNRMIRTGEIPQDECAAAKASLHAMAVPDPAAAREAVYRFFLEGQLTDAHLRVWDGGSMASGLEVRVPYLDRSVRDVAFALPWEQRIRGRVRKALLREVARKVLPASLAAVIVDRPKLAAPSAVRRTAEALDRAAREILPSDEREPHPLQRYCATPAQRILLDLFVYLFIGRGGDLPEDFRWRELYTTHRRELTEALTRV